MFTPVVQQVVFSKLEEEILAFWKKNKIFEKSISSRPADRTWAFLDGPPFITGLPHYGSLLSSIPKDVFPRFWTMKGYRVRRVWGWDCHGLPAENKVETKLQLTSKRDIEEKIGVQKFIDECKLYVKDVSSEWEWYIDHIGRWVDFEHAYKTMDVPYMESVMWVFKQMYDKDYIYKGLRVSLYCPHDATPISNFEVAMDADNYKDVTEAADVYKYKIKGEKNSYLLAWSTTPWNKLVTPALAVNPHLTYVKVTQGKEQYILAKTTINMLTDEPYSITEEFPGKDLIGLSFEPHYDFYPIDSGKKAFIVVGGEFVTADEGTGIVTLAAYGEEDLVVMQKENIQIAIHLDEEGNLKKDVPKWGGMYYLKVNKLVNADLLERGLLYREDLYTHSIPTCWRCHTRLLYAPQNAWYINVQELKKEMIKTNESVHWFPKHFKHGRFQKSVDAAPDWCISRSRYWGSPVPVWECECGERIVPGSIAELETLSGKKITDLHKPQIDEVIIRCAKCGKDAKRVPEVLDSWIEAGSASFAERHYPFDKKAILSNFFPPDFIVEYTGQIRAWFYVLHVIANALHLYDDNTKNILSKNVLVTGIILGTDGRKMSKNYGNYPDPKGLLEKYGGDALRLYLMGSPVMHGEDILISEEQYRNQVRGMMLILWNVYNFFVSYALVDGWNKNNKSVQSVNVLDKWILSLLAGLSKNVTNAFETYDTVQAVELYTHFIDQLSTWYIRRSRDRVGPLVDDADKESFYQTTYTVLVTLTKLLAPMTPFMAESIYQNLTQEESVHLADWPSFDEKQIDEELEKNMSYGMEVASLIHMKRKTNNIKVRIPLREFHYTGQQALPDEIQQIVQEEGNVEKLVYDKKTDIFEASQDFDIAAPENLDLEAGKAREIIRKIQQERKLLGTQLNEQVDVTIEEWPKAFEAEIKKRALIRELVKGESFVVKRL